ncbi:MAG TPA: DUF4926 domain-containing protein [Longimicrobium sp.]|nr:DUF4926 domain-containing protein [Longimicrobium sp.]
MKLPNAERAFVDPVKVRDYLLNPYHPVGCSKAYFFAALGFARRRWAAQDFPRFVTAFYRRCTMKKPVCGLDAVVLLRDLPDAGLRAGDVGAVVHLYSPEAFEVEFVARSGETVALRTLSAADVRLARDEDLATPPSRG